MVKIKKVEREGLALEHARVLFSEYATELDENLCFQSFDDELKDPLKKYGPPSGTLYVAYTDNQPVACIALQPIKPSGVCEMKRLYVKPASRKSGIGDKLVEVLLADARQKGYTKMVLDTLERLQSAIRLYQRHGFINTSPYYQNPLRGVVYLEREL